MSGHSVSEREIIKQTDLETQRQADQEPFVFRMKYFVTKVANQLILLFSRSIFLPLSISI